MQRISDDSTVAPETEVRETDYGDDVAATEAQAVSTRFDPGTTERVRRAVRVFVIVLAGAFVIVSLMRLFHAYTLRHAAASALSAAPAVDVIEAQPVASVQRFSLTGETAAWYTSTIYARVNGYVARWFVDIGDHVEKGAVLALIETPELDAQLAAERAELKRAEADVQVRKAEVGFAKSQYERWRDSPKGVVSEQEREQKRTDYESAQARYQASEAQVALERAQVERFTSLSQFKRVSAPYAGVITARDIDIGNLVTAGSTSATTPLYVMTQNDPMRVFVDVPQSAAADLLQGNVPVTIQRTDGTAQTYEGTVSRTSKAINAQARTMRVEVDIDNKDDSLLPGLYVKATFGLPPKGLVQVPAAALLFRASGPQVARVASDGKIVFQSVTIARDDGNVVELSSGVSPGDKLALNLSSQITSGELVRVNSAPQPDALAAEVAATGR